MASVIKIASGATAAQIQSAINSAAAGSTIRLAAGNYTFDRSVVINRDDIAIVGAGQGKTVINLTKDMKGAPAFQIGPRLFDEDLQNPVQIADAKAGATTVQITSGNHSLKPGDAIWIERANDDALFEAIGDTQWREDKPLRTGMAIVKSVDGGKVTLDRPLPFDFAQDGTVLSEMDLAKGVTLRGLTLKGAHGTANPAKFSNTISAENGGMMLVANGTQGLVLDDIAILDAGSNGLVLAKTLDARITDILVDGAHNKGGGGNGYGIWIRDVYNSDFSGLQIFDTRHAVLFASYTSAVGNSVQVDKTNRDINFHGGLDHDNTVIVDWSVRNGAEQSYLGSVSFVNPGTDYGAPTDPDANIIRFKKVVGSAREDLVFAVQSGADIATMAGSDLIIGGRGHDRLDGGTGNDTILASSGRDTVLGGQGQDLLLMEAKRADIRFVKQDGKIGIVGELGVTWLDGIETLQLSDAKLTAADMAKAASTAQLRLGQSGFEWVQTRQDVVAGQNLNGLELGGTKGVTVVGNAIDNRVKGSAGADVMALLDGRDWAQGGEGADVLSGGGGHDQLFGGKGKDLLNGGIGDDRLTGGAGADRFVAGQGRDIITDFSMESDDQFAFREWRLDGLLDDLQDWRDGRRNPDGFQFKSLRLDGTPAFEIVSPSDQHLILLGVTAKQMFDFYL
jgi:Ca2+-binding RTX toxin-like protein